MNRPTSPLHAATVATIRAEVAAQGTTIKGLARRMDVDAATIRKWMRLDANMTLRTVERLAAGLGVEVEVVLRGK